VLSALFQVNCGHDEVVRSFLIHSVSRSKIRTTIYENYKSESWTARWHSDSKAESQISSSDSL